jgi:hypothetical protein
LRFINTLEQERKSPPQRSLSWCLIWWDRGSTVVGNTGPEFVTTFRLKMPERARR